MNIELIFLIVGGTFLTFGDLLMKQWVKVTSGDYFLSLYYILGMVFYISGLTLYAYTLKSKNIAIATTILIIFNLITVYCAGYFFFNEKYNWYQLLGICIGIISIFFLEL